MKKIMALSVSFLLLFLLGDNVSAQMMGGNYAADDHTPKEEAAGKEIWGKLQAKQTDCGKLSDDNFDSLGEYFMGTMMGDAHAAMNEMITRMHGEEGEKQIHVVLGKRLSGCDTSAAFPAGGLGWMPMMQGGWSSPSGYNTTNNMMNLGYGFGFFGWILMILWWALIIGGIVALIKWMIKRSGGFGCAGKSALDILKERYAKGEIDTKEFEDKKKNLPA